MKIMNPLKHSVQFLLGIGVFLILMAPTVNAAIGNDNKFIYPEYSKTISMDFKDASLTDVLKVFSQQSGMNFIASDDISSKKITLYLDNVPVESALEQILSANNLTYEIQPNSDIFTVKAVDRPSKKLMTRVYGLKYASVKSSKINQTITIGKAKDKDGEEASSNATTGETDDATGIGIAAAIKTILSDSGVIVEDPRTNSLIVTDIPSQFPLIEQTIARLDVQIPQVLIETEMLDISKGTSDKLGLKIGDTPLTFTGGKREAFYPWDNSQVVEKGGLFTKEYTAGLINATGLTAMLQFLKTQTDTKYLARPRILTLNNETAQIKISTNEAIGISTQTGASEGLSTQSLQAERVETGVFLNVTPQVNLLTKSITMAIAPKVIQARTGATFSGTTFKDPEERGTKSMLRVNDGETIILGGLMRTDLTDTRTRFPVLSDVPLIGAAFRHKDKTNSERELIIFITPHICSDQQASNQLAMSVPQKIEREQRWPASDNSKRKREVERTLKLIESQRR